jgi:two-component system nitrate/nitrite response regulator NarL
VSRATDFRQEPSHPLSQRELAVLRKVTSGASNQKIAFELGVPEAAVNVHIRSLFKKIGVPNRTQAAKWASDHGIQDS